MSELVVVLAGNHAQFRQWARAAGLDPHSRSLVYARDVDALRGIHGARVVRCGTWHLRPDWRELDAYSAVCVDRTEMAPAT
ncbi:hypothetical protein ACFVZH_08080 [Streptomyces sp. NPDC059534]|uniref:hypothetical protein n=1 Tax=Streptomyces sp. NPDC059534 TaxID=3346859 RepID=UPI0036C8D455